LYVISACLCGIKCKYNGGSNTHPIFKEMLKNHQVIPVCPEQMGGLPTPRTPCEIINGTGDDVIDGKAKVLNRDGHDVTEQFLRGAYEVLNFTREGNIKSAIFKSRSPSCGVKEIYDGSFSGKLIPGNGVTTALLHKHGINVINDEDFIKE